MLLSNDSIEETLKNGLFYGAGKGNLPESCYQLDTPAEKSFLLTSNDSKMKKSKRAVPSASERLMNLQPSENFKEIKIRIKKSEFIIIGFMKNRVMNVSGESLESAAEKFLNKLKEKSLQIA